MQEVTLHKGGTKEVTLPVDEVEIPDVWKVVEELDIPLGPQRQALLDCWSIAWALKRHLQLLPLIEKEGVMPNAKGKGFGK